MQARDRLPSIQTLRGVAAMLVVLHHCINLIEDRGGAGCSRIAGAFWNNDFGASGVDLFFVISGFVMAHALDRDAGRRGGVPARSRYPHRAAVLAAGAGEPGGRLGERQPAERRVARQHAHLRARRAGGLAAAEAIARPAAAAPAFATNPILLEFALGVVVRLVTRRPLDPRLSGLMRVAGLFGIIWTILTGFGFGMDPWPLIEGDTPLRRVWTWGVPWSLVLLGGVAMTGPSGVVGRIGDASYSLYLSHALVLAAVAAAWPRWSGIMPDVVLVASFIAALGIGLLVYDRIERPLHRWLAARSRTPVPDLSPAPARSRVRRSERLCARRTIAS